MVKMPDGGFRPDQEEKPRPLDPLPRGWYAMSAISIEVENTKRGDGWMFAVTFEVDENRHPEHKGRKVWERFNMGNPSADAQRIGRSQFAAFCTAAGFPTHVEDTDQLLGRPVAVKVKVIPAERDFEERNGVSGFEPLAARESQLVRSGARGGPAPAAPAAPAKPAAPAAPAAPTSGTTAAAPPANQAAPPASGLPWDKPPQG